MPPKQRYSRDKILQCAYQLLIERGCTSINARIIANALGCSTQPIFTYFPDMSSLRHALSQKAFGDLNLVLNLSSSSLLDYCCAYVLFAMERPNVFSYLSNSYDKSFHPFTFLSSSAQQLFMTKHVDGLKISDTFFRRFLLFTEGMAHQFLVEFPLFTVSDIHRELEFAYAALNPSSA